MQRVLLVETASPRRVRKKAEDILAGRTYQTSELTVLSRDNPHSVRYLSELPGLRIVPFQAGKGRVVLQELRKAKFDIVFSFWTGDKRYLRMKLAALRIPASEHYVDIGDGRDFRLSPGTFLWFLRTRWKYPHPSDCFAYAWHEPDRKARSSADSLAYDGEEILIIQSAEPPVVLRALEKLKVRPLFRQPRYTLFCRNHKEIVEQFQGHPMLHRIATHVEARDALKHLAALRRVHFDSVVVFFTGDPSYWKVKFLPFLLGTRHKLVFNEHNDCFFFSWRAWQAHISRRLADNWEPALATPRLTRTRALATVTLKLLLFPFRFAWLLLVWLWLRTSGLRSHGERYDRAL